MPKEVNKLKAPFLVLGNHTGFFDPFIAGHFLKPFVHYVASDSAFRNPFFRFFLTRLGTIPKKKNMTDSQVIRDIIRVVQQGECIGIFPEAVRNWAGTTFYFDPSIIKLIRKLNIPVVSTKIKGMNLFNPRWSRKLRKTKVEIEYELIFTFADYAKKTEEELYRQLRKALHHDEVEHQRKNRNPIQSKSKAEYISHVLCICPDCKGIDTFRCQGNDFECQSCNYDIHIDEFGFFQRKTQGSLIFDNIRDWYYWQEKYLTDLVHRRLSEKDSNPIMTDEGSYCYHSLDGLHFTLMGTANIELYANRIEILFEKDGHTLVFQLGDLQTINPQVHEHLEIYYQNRPYRIIGGRPGVSALKWEIAVNAIWFKTGQMNKLSPYIRPYEN